MNINDLVIEQYITERSFRSRMVQRTAASARSHAIAGQLRSLSKASPLRTRIAKQRLQLRMLMDQERRQFGARAKSRVMSSR